MRDDLQKLNGLSTQFVAVLTEAAMALVLGLTTAIFFNWQVTLLCMLLSPILILGGVCMSKS